MTEDEILAVKQSPHGYAWYCSNKEWKPYSFLKHISKVIWRALEEGDGRLIFNVPPQHGKCLSGDTLVQLSDGGMVAIKDIQEGQEVMSMDNFTPSTDIVMSKKCTGVKGVSKLTTYTGKELTLTPEHRLLTFEGWKESKDITGKDYICTPDYLPEGTADFLDGKSAALLAYYLAEGTKVGNGLLITNESDKVISELYDICADNGWRIHDSRGDGLHWAIYLPNKGHNRNKKKPIHLLKALTGTDLTTYNFRMPRMVWLATNSVVSVFINRFYACDGNINRATGAIELCLANRDFIRDMQLLLMRFGIRSKASYKPTSCNGKKFDSYILRVDAKTDVIKFCDEIGILGKDTDLCREKALRRGPENSKINALPASWRGYLKNTASYFRQKHNIRIDKPGVTHKTKVLRCAEIEGNKDLLDRVEHVSWDRVRRIEDVGEAPTYDIETKKHHNFIANGLVSHNSTFISKWLPLWYLENNPKGKVILTTYGDDYAASWGRAIKTEIVANTEVNINLMHDSRASNRFNTVQGGQVITGGTGGQITGKGGDLIIIDDPHKNLDEVISEAYQRRFKDWFNGVIYTRRQPKTTIILLMTRWAKTDLTEWLMTEHADKWRVVDLPALAVKGDKLGREEGQALCPERFDREDLLKTKQAVGSLFWSGMYQQRPTSLGGNIVKRDWIKLHNMPVDVMEDVVMSWDMSFKDTTKGSYVCGQVWGRMGAKFYLLDQIRERMGFTATKTAVVAMCAKWPEARRKLIEEKANGAAIIDALRDSIPGIVPVVPTESKQARMAAVSPYYEAGNVHYDRNAPWLMDHINEICDFPTGKSDDQADTESQALSELVKGVRYSGVDDFEGIGGIAAQTNNEFGEL